MSAFCGCFKSNANTHVTGNAPDKNPNRDSRRRSGMNNGAENALLEMNKKGALSDNDYPIDTEEWGGVSGDRSQSPKPRGYGRMTN